MTKIHNIAALCFRILGAFLLLDGVIAAVVLLIDLVTKFFDKNAKIVPNGDGLGFLIVGWLLFRYSKKLAVLFCKGLDDESPQP